MLAFARDLRIHHATLSRILDRPLRITPRAIRHVGPRLSLSSIDIEAACLDANADWPARLINDPRAAVDSRRLAVLSGMPIIEDVNVALHHLLHHRRAPLRSSDHWELVSA